jgi:transcriptional regulator with XRE-family HTH domain
MGIIILGLHPMNGNIEKMFGEEVRILRRKLGLSQEALAEVCELHRTYIGSVERGERNVSLRNIAKIARALDVTPSWLLKNIK